MPQNGHATDSSVVDGIASWDPVVGNDMLAFRREARRNARYGQPRFARSICKTLHVLSDASAML